MQEEFAEEKVKYIEGEERERVHELSELRDDLRFQFERKKLSFDKRIQNKEKEQKRTIEVYENQLDNLKRNSAKTLEQENTEERRPADRTALSSEK